MLRRRHPGDGRRRGDPELLGLADAIRVRVDAGGHVRGGLLLLAAGTVLAAIAIWRSGMPPRWSGIPLAVGIGAFLPQFFAAPPVRMAHGLLVAIGCGCVAFMLWRAFDPRDRTGSVATGLAGRRPARR